MALGETEGRIGAKIQWAQIVKRLHYGVMLIRIKKQLFHREKSVKTA